jgi:hypothetical protein
MCQHPLPDPWYMVPAAFHATVDSQSVTCAQLSKGPIRECCENCSNLVGRRPLLSTGGSMAHTSWWDLTVAGPTHVAAL